MVVLILAIGLVYYLENSADTYSYKIYKVNDGYGYQVLVNDKLLIKQDFVPTLEGFTAFTTKNQAESAAKQVVSKLRNNEIPALTNTEIDKLIR